MTGRSLWKFVDSFSAKGALFEVSPVLNMSRVYCQTHPAWVQCVYLDKNAAAAEQHGRNDCFVTFDKSNIYTRSALTGQVVHIGSCGFTGGGYGDIALVLRSPSRTVVVTDAGVTSIVNNITRRTEGLVKVACRQRWPPRAVFLEGVLERLALFCWSDGDVPFLKTMHVYAFDDGMKARRIMKVEGNFGLDVIAWPCGILILANHHQFQEVHLPSGARSDLFDVGMSNIRSIAAVPEYGVFVRTRDAFHRYKVLRLRHAWISWCVWCAL